MTFHHPIDLASSARLAAVATAAATIASAVLATASIPLTGAEAEAFLRSARVVDMVPIGTGVTRPMRATLQHEGREARAAWKTVDEYRPVKDFRDGGLPELGFSDSYKHEIAAYELDKLLGLGLVPPTVERRIKGKKGSLQLWIENSMTETERMEGHHQAPDPEAWNRQMYDVRVFLQLIYDSDFNNTGNLLIDEDFRLWSIDASRAFRTKRDLLSPDDLERFSRRTLAALEALDLERLERGLGRWLTPVQRKALLARRDLILERARRLVGERGEEAVLLP